MKFIFSFLLMTSTLHARDFIVIQYHEKAIEEAKLVESSIVNQLNFPRDYIKRIESICEVNPHTLATICIDESSRVNVTHVNQVVMTKLLAAFGGNDENE